MALTLRYNEMANPGSSLKKKMKTAILTERIDVHGPEVAIFRLRPKEGDLFSFTPGQYATLGLDIGNAFVARAYSIAGSPCQRDHLELYINVIDDGGFTPALFALRQGDELYYMGPKGIFTLAKSNTRHLLLVATGTGLAPYVSMLRTLHQQQQAGTPHGRTITLIHGVRYTADLGYRWELDGMARDKDFNLLYLPMVSRPGEDRHWTSEVGRGRTTALLEKVTEAILPEGLTAADVAARFPLDDTAVFLCGNPDMIADAKRTLAAQGCQEIYTEEYW